MYIFYYSSEIHDVFIFLNMKIGMILLFMSENFNIWVIGGFLIDYFSISHFDCL